MAKVIASVPTTVSPGYLTSIRPPSRKSNDMPVSHARPRASRTSSLNLSTPPNRNTARRRASSGLIPACKFFFVSISRWKASSSSSSRSTASLCASARRRFFQRFVQVIGTVSGSGGAQDQIDHLDVAAPLLGLGAQRAASGGGELVVLGPPVLVRGAPHAVDPPLLLEPLQGRVERTLAHQQRLLR